MLTVYYLMGIPGSGKSHWAKRKMAEQPGAFVRTNKDLLRECMHYGKWSRDNEKQIIPVRDFIIETGLRASKHVIVDDTGFSEKHKHQIEEITKKFGAKMEVVDFSSVPLETCLERNRQRVNAVPEHVIRDMHAQYCVKAVEPPACDPALPSIVIVDVDGTVAQMNGRGPFDWHRVGEDLPREHVIHAVKSYGSHRIFLSGRDECCREATERWLGRFFLDVRLFMRPAGDMRKDAIVKTEIYEREIRGKYNVLGIWDDRPQMIRAWQALGFADRIFNVGDGREF